MRVWNSGTGAVLAALLAVGGCTASDGTDTQEDVGSPLSEAIRIEPATSSSSPSPTTPSPSTGSGGAPETPDAIAAAFLAYNQALLDRNFERACDLLTPAATRAVVNDMEAKTARRVDSCEHGFELSYSQTEGSSLLDQIGQQIEIVSVTRSGDLATVEYRSTLHGEPLSDTAEMELIEDRWLVVEATHMV